MLDEANKLFESFEKATVDQRWHMPFPMGVFGTLRKNCGNDRLMYSNAPYQSHHRAFLPHFYAQGLGIYCQKDCSGVFEVYTYKPEDWAKMIPRVDGLEGFRPGEPKYEYGYWRTLVYLHILPDDFGDDQYFNLTEKSDRNSWRRFDDKRTFNIKPEEWSKYPRVPCWVYSSIRHNREARKIDGHTIIWDSTPASEQEAA